MDVREAIARRVSVRRYRDESVPDDVLQRLLEAMRRASSGSNRQPWRFIVVREAKMRQALAEASRYYPGAPEGQAFVAQAPLLIAAAGDPGEAAVKYRRDDQWPWIGAGWPQEGVPAEVEHESFLLVDLVIALDHLTLAAMAEGLGTCWIGGLDEALIKQVLGIPETWRAPLFLTVGYPTEWPAPRRRKPLDEIISFERF